MIISKRICSLVCSFLLAVSVLGCSSLSVSAASDSLWNTSGVASSVTLKKTLTTKQKKQLASYQKKDKAVGKAVSAADRKKTVKALKSVSKYVLNFDYSLYQNKSQKTAWKKQIKKILPSCSSSRISSLWNTLVSAKQIRSSAPLTAGKYLTYKKGNKKRIIAYWAVNYAAPEAADAASYCILKTTLKKTGSGFTVASVTAKYDSSAAVSGGNGDSSSVTEDTPSSSSGSGISGGGSTGNGSAGGSDDGSGESSSSGSVDGPDGSASSGSVDGTDNVVDIGDLGWDRLFS